MPGIFFGLGHARERARFAESPALGNLAARSASRRPRLPGSETNGRLTRIGGADTLARVLFGTRRGAALGFGLSLVVALGTSFCGGKSSRDDTQTEGGASELGTGGAPIASGGAIAQGGAAANTGGEPTHSGGMQANSGGMQASGGMTTSGGAAASSGGASGATSGGASSACVGVDGSVSPESRRCLIDSDCGVLVQPACCETKRVIGVAKYLMCAASPPDVCAGVDCDGQGGFQADDGTRSSNGGEVTVFCRFGERGEGECRTTLTGGEMAPPLLCAGEECDAGELCVHRSARGGPGPRCFEVPADGVCPADTELASCNGGLPGCVELLLEPKPECAAVPPGCDAVPGCACLPPELCGPSQRCASTSGRHVYCRDESP